jgi:hypothetical protein
MRIELNGSELMEAMWSVGKLTLMPASFADLDDAKLRLSGAPPADVKSSS